MLRVLAGALRACWCAPNVLSTLATDPDDDVYQASNQYDERDHEEDTKDGRFVFPKVFAVVTQV